MKQVYSYHPISFEFTGVDQADPDQMNIGCYLLPANTTEVKPPACSKKFVLRFDQDKWIRVPIEKSMMYITRAVKIRSVRNRMLFESDWTQALDVPEYINRKEWRRYRQLLRDLPEQKEFPFKCKFPDVPENLKNKNHVNIRSTT
jgi:hypothetical protein